MWPTTGSGADEAGFFAVLEGLFAPAPAEAPLLRAVLRADCPGLPTYEPCVSAAEMKVTILRAGAAAPGPDGIPAAAYYSCADTAARGACTSRPRDHVD